MHQELSESTRLALGISIVVLILTMVLLMMQISVNVSRNYTNDIALAVGKAHGGDLMSLNAYGKEVPVPVIYLALASTKESVKEFELNVGGTVYTDINKLKEYQSTKMFIDVQESNGYYKVRVRDR